MTHTAARHQPVNYLGTSIFGVLPLVLATGAGVEMRQSLDTAVFSGMIGVTVFGLFLTPVFFFVLLWFGRREQAHTTPLPQADGTAARRGVDASQRVPATR